MGTPGVPWDCPKEKIVETLKKRKGILTHVCKDLEISHGPLLKHINKDPELVELLSELRNEASNVEVDIAINTVMYAMAQREKDLRSALSASYYVLNHKGKDRGYGGRDKASRAINDEDAIRDFVSSTAFTDEQISSAFESCESLLEDQQSLLDQRCRGQENQIPAQLGTETALE